MVQEKYADYLKYLIKAEYEQRELLDNEKCIADSALYDTFVKEKKKCCTFVVDSSKSAGVAYDGKLTPFITEDVVEKLVEYLEENGFVVWYHKSLDTLKIDEVIAYLYDPENDKSEELFFTNTATDIADSKNIDD